MTAHQDAELQWRLQLHDTDNLRKWLFFFIIISSFTGSNAIYNRNRLFISTLRCPVTRRLLSFSTLSQISWRNLTMWAKSGGEYLQCFSSDLAQYSDTWSQLQTTRAKATAECELNGLQHDRVIVSDTQLRAWIWSGDSGVSFRGSRSDPAVQLAKWCFTHSGPELPWKAQLAIKKDFKWKD